MDALAALIAGALAKIYDDGTDMNLIKDPYHIKYLETLHCYLLGAISMNDFTFTIINFIANILNYFANNAANKDPYERSLLVLYPIFILLNFQGESI